MNIENKEENMTYYLYTGTYTGGMHSDLEVTGSKGIYIYRMDEETNKLHPLGVFGGDEIDPAFLAIKDNLLFAEKLITGGCGKRKGSKMRPYLHRPCWKLCDRGGILKRQCAGCPV